MIDPLLGGLWVMTTASGAVYSIDATDPDRAATIRRSAEPLPSTSHLLPATLRRDGEAIGLIALRHRAADNTIAPGLRVGAEALLVLEPLAYPASVTLRWTTPVVGVERVDQGPSLPEVPLGDDAEQIGGHGPVDPDVALMERRQATDSGRRFGVNEVIRALGYERGELESEIIAERTPTGGSFVVDVVRATSGWLAVNIPAPAHLVLEVEHLHEVEPVARATLGGILDVPADQLDVSVRVDSLLLPGEGAHRAGRAILITPEDEAKLAYLQHHVAGVAPEARELLNALLTLLRRPPL